MTPVRAIKNQYVGVNAHLHSEFQARILVRMTAVLNAASQGD